MSTELQTTQPNLAVVPSDVSAGALEAAIGMGDFSRLTPSDRLRYLAKVCESVGLNPLTKPIDIISIGGKVVMYANKGCAEQLRAIHGVSIEVVDRHTERGCCVVRVRARDAKGRQDESIAMVPLPDNASGEAFAIASMKCETKAKRRATLSICGLGNLQLHDDDAPERGGGVVTDVATVPVAGLLNAQTMADEPAGERERLLAEIRSELLRIVPGQTVDDKRRKADLMERSFGARRWEAVTHLTIAQLEAGLANLRDYSDHTISQVTAQPSVVETPAETPPVPSVSSSFAPVPADQFPIARESEASLENAHSGASATATPVGAVKPPGTVSQAATFLEPEIQMKLAEAIGGTNIVRAIKWLRDPKNGGRKAGYLDQDDDMDALPLKTAQRIIKNPGGFASAIGGVK